MAIFLEQLCERLQAKGVEYAIVGGHAVALLGAVMGTVDIDFVVKWTKDNVLRAEAALKDLGLVSTLPITGLNILENQESYIKERNLIAWNFHAPDDLSKQVDLIINYDLSVATTTLVPLLNTTISVLNKEALIAMKLASGREQDIEDIKALRLIP